MSAGLHALRDHGVHTALRGGYGLGDRGHLRDHLNITAVSVGNEWPGISSEQAEDRKPSIEAGGEFVSLQDRDDQIRKKRLTSESPHAPDLFADYRCWQAHQS
jgi:hypothetical protein